MGCFSNGSQGSGDKLRIPKVKSIKAGQLFSAQNSASAISFPEGNYVDDPSRSQKDGKNAPQYNTLIFEALSTIKDSNGTDIDAIVGFIEQRHDVPQNFRRLLSLRLRRLVLQGKLEKVHNCYKIKDAELGTKTPTPKQNDVRPRPSQNSRVIIASETVEDAAMTAAYKIAEAENKSFVAAEAVKEAERVSRMAEDTEAVLQIVKEIYEQCSRGESILWA
ncbi:unnamed protein product [Ilex paraguariensis]